MSGMSGTSGTPDGGGGARIDSLLQDAWRARAASRRNNVCTSTRAASLVVYGCTIVLYTNYTIIAVNTSHTPNVPCRVVCFLFLL